MSDVDMKSAEDLDKIKKHFWKELADSPFVMIGLTGDGEHSIPMNAQLDKDANSAIWFFTSTDNRLARGGDTMMQFVSKGHDIYACVEGTLVEETDKARLDKMWDNSVEAWYEHGKSDPKLLMLRFDLGGAEIWEPDMGITGLFKMLTGNTIDKDNAGEHAKVSL